MSSMFCFQCEQADQGEGCQLVGVCGKEPETACLQDLLLYLAKGLALYAHRLRALGVSDREFDLTVLESLFTTVTNVNFDNDRLAVCLRDTADVRDRARARYLAACQAAGQAPDELDGPATLELANDLAGLIDQGEALCVEHRLDDLGEDLVGLQELLCYGVKGLAAYADHALILGYEDDAVFAFCHEALAALVDPAPELSNLLALCLRCGEVNLRTMELLDQANTSTYGQPVPTPVRVTPVAGKAILVSGHDLKDLELLLEQTAGRGINVYTHGEMLPAHGYPKLKAYPHLAGNYGGAWQDQEKEFAAFPGAILMTTNCIQEPAASYLDRIFTSGLVAWPGVTHVGDGDFTPVIEAALAAPGFARDEPSQTILVGFARDAVLGVAGQVVDAVKGGALRHFFLVGGCDGAKPGRNYYTDFAEQVPDDCVVLTLGCGKYRFNKLPFGDIGGIPRLLDCGQCNDAYSAIQIAVALAGAFETDVNSLPLSLIVSWYEQKAVAVLLTLLHLGLRGIRLGPTVPAFLTPALLKVLMDSFDLKPITTAEQDLRECLA